MRKLIFFIGGAGAGKTTLAKALAKRRRPALFDMDTLSRPASEAIMTLSGLDPEDRDSVVYKERCRDLGYRLTMDAALENLEIGTDAIVIGPFTKETDDPQWLERELARIGVTLDDVEVKVVFVTLQDEKLYHKRIRDRGLSLDAWKLENWDEFSRSLVERTVRWNLPDASVLYFDNSEPISEETVSVIERFVYGSEAFG
jgi:adenylate kinase family enzyme